MGIIMKNINPIQSNNDADADDMKNIDKLLNEDSDDGGLEEISALKKFKESQNSIDFKKETEINVLHKETYSKKTTKNINQFNVKESSNTQQSFKKIDNTQQSFEKFEGASTYNDVNSFVRHKIDEKVKLRDFHKTTSELNELKKGRKPNYINYMKDEEIKSIVNKNRYNTTNPTLSRKDFLEEYRSTKS